MLESESESRTHFPEMQSISYRPSTLDILPAIDIYDISTMAKRDAQSMTKSSNSEIDLTMGEMDDFRATFDFYTPRPHLILMLRCDNVAEIKRRRKVVYQSGQRPMHVWKSDFQDLSDKERLSLVKTAQFLRVEFDLSQSILSLHRGSWVSALTHFHGHLCVDTERYIRLFNDQDMPLDESYVTKAWRLSRQPEDYTKNVRGYPYQNYHKDDLQQIATFMRQNDKTSRRLKSNETWGVPPLLLVFHKTQPRIGFKPSDLRKTAEPRAEKTPEDLLSILDAVEWFAAKNGLTRKGDRSRDSSRGCHVCLLIGEEAWRDAFPDEPDVVAYIELSAVTFYQICPNIHADGWFKHYRKLASYSSRT